MSAVHTKGVPDARSFMAKKKDDNIPTTSKAGNGAGTRSGGVSGGKHRGGTKREDKNANPRGKGSGNR